MRGEFLRHDILVDSAHVHCNLTIQYAQCLLLAIRAGQQSYIGIEQFQQSTFFTGSQRSHGGSNTKCRQRNISTSKPKEFIS